MRLAPEAHLRGVGEYGRSVAGESTSGGDEVRTGEVIGSLCLATDLGMGLPLEHGLQSTLVAMRLADRFGVDHATASQTYYGCLLFYVGCTVDAEVAAGLFRGELLRHFNPVMLGTQAQTMAGIMRALPNPGQRAAGALPCRQPAGSRRLFAGTGIISPRCARLRPC